ncbi:MAG TPA: hypothetical protein PKI59_07180 [Candidatus Cloacimonadota bacterium]|nr:hypothetical protein [Candidatus Cloacimonadota bacterium]
MKKVLFIIMVLSLALFIAACGSNKKLPKPDGDVVYRPAWWGEQKYPDFVCTYGQATNAKETISIGTAKNNALFEAAQYVEAEVKGMMKTYEEEAGVENPQILALSSSVIKTVANVKFSGAIPDLIETRSYTEGGKKVYKTWIQMKIPKDAVNKTLIDNIRNEEALYNQFKASQAFMELDKELGE